MLYAFSGGWHALKKVEDDSRKKGLQYAASFTPDELHFSLQQLTKNLKAGEQLSNISAVKMNDEMYWQLTAVNAQSKPVKKYIHQSAGKELAEGDRQYAQHAAGSLIKRDDVKLVKKITAFNAEYSMMNKRLPVVQVAYQNGESYFIETSTGIVAAVVNGADRAERFSFSNLHMHHYAEKWSGKGLRNTILIATTLGLLLVACTGIIMYVKKRWL